MITRFLNFLSAQGIAAQINLYSYSPVSPLQWKNGLYYYTNDLPFVSNRDILSNNANNLKYAEKIVFSSKGSNFAVLIGYNPSLYSPVAIDKTNYLIANLLYNKGYDGYYLFNMFPEVTPQKISKSNSIYPQCIDDVLDFLIADSAISMDDVFIFWGSTAYVSVSVENKLKRLQSFNRKLYTIGTTVISHQHPGRNVSLKTIASHSANLDSIVPYFRYLK